MLKQIEFFDLNHARQNLVKQQEPFVLINSQGSSRFLGALALDKIFCILMVEFAPSKIIFRVDEDMPALFYALRFGYKNILYTGNSVAAKKMLECYLKK